MLLRMSPKSPVRDGIVRIERDEHLADRQGLLKQVQSLYQPERPEGACTIVRIGEFTLKPGLTRDHQSWHQPELPESACVIVRIGEFTLKPGLTRDHQALPDRDRLVMAIEPHRATGPGRPTARAPRGSPGRAARTRLGPSRTIPSPPVTRPAREDLADPEEGGGQAGRTAGSSPCSLTKPRRTPAPRKQLAPQRLHAGNCQELALADLGERFIHRGAGLGEVCLGQMLGLFGRARCRLPGACTARPSGPPDPARQPAGSCSRPRSSSRP